MLQLRHYEVCKYSHSLSYVDFTLIFAIIYIAVHNSKTEQFIKECIMAKRFNHPNILSLIGVSYIKGEAVPLMILPFMHNGDVKSFVKSKRNDVLEVTKFPDVSYLHSCIHSNLTINNLWLSCIYVHETF